MSYAIIRNDKLKRVDAQGSYIHNDRRSKGHSNKDIDPTRTHLNFWCRKNELTYIKEFDKMKKEYDLKGTISSQGTTPRRYTDLLGSLSDLTSGSGDKGTPIVLIKNYFKNYAE